MMMLSSTFSSCNFVSVTLDPKNRPCFYRLLIVASLFCAAYFIGSAYLRTDYKDRIFSWGSRDLMQRTDFNEAQSNACKNPCRPLGTEALPEGITARTSNLEMLPLWGADVNMGNSKPSMNLLAIAVGVRQKEVVKKIVDTFLSSDFIVMLFHYDGVVDEWRGIGRTDRVIHVSAINQTKWWFAKRFLHPDIVTEYSYIFLWDEDLGVENFNPQRYLSIVKEEGLEISQPALDPVKSLVHHPITARVRKSRVHRRVYKLKGSGRCYGNSTAPPCTGWVEMMAPVFSRAAWKCVWHMVQNDLIHAWGLDMLLGYCAQGDRTQNVGVVDSEYIVHLGLPTLGVTHRDEIYKELPSNNSSPEDMEPTPSLKVDNRSAVRLQSFVEMKIFKKRWSKAVEEDMCWTDVYQNNS